MLDLTMHVTAQKMHQIHARCFAALFQTPKCVLKPIHALFVKLESHFGIFILWFPRTKYGVLCQFFGPAGRFDTPLCLLQTQVHAFRLFCF